jgi:hypothetical protein
MLWGRQYNLFEICFLLIFYWVAVQELSGMYSCIRTRQARLIILLFFPFDGFILEKSMPHFIQYLYAKLF